MTGTVFHVSHVWIVVAADRSVVAVHSMEQPAQAQAESEGFTVECWPIERTPSAAAWAGLAARRIA